MSCSTDVSGYDLYRCGKDNILYHTEDHYMVNADDGRWPEDLMCSIMAPQQPQYTTDDNTYRIEAMMYNHRSGSSTNLGHLGIMYNARDHSNYDFVYIR